MTTPELPQPDEPNQPLERYFFVKNAPQDEINVRFGWIAEELQLDKVERRVLYGSFSQHIEHIGKSAMQHMFEGLQHIGRFYC